MATDSESVQSSKATSGAADLKCHLCGGVRINRMERVGLLDKWIYPLLGYYPWRCSICRKKIYLKQRYRRGDARKNYVE